ncbi:UNVERIFIED_CONTAM: hypothetical protein Sradi_4050000 [Sesamum radiatum]|uniref:Reverse transcriptase zinc-binding domain-containing protein n=1 Tax=Sesamum radiatum TaxID=300843 RepID=A0AAW2PNT0_SESRA
MPLPITPQQDNMLWARSKSSIFSIRTAYSWLLNESHSSSTTHLPWKSLWKIKALPRVLFHAWLLGHYCLPTAKFLHERHRHDTCSLCKSESDTIEHVYTRSSSISTGINTNNTAEVWALHQGLSIALDKGFDKLVIETDSKMLTTLFCRHREPPRHLLPLLQDCKVL